MGSDLREEFDRVLIVQQKARGIVAAGPVTTTSRISS